MEIIWISADAFFGASVLAAAEGEPTKWWEYLWGIFWMAINMGTFIMVWALNGRQGRNSRQLLSNSERLTRLEERTSGTIAGERETP